MPLLLSSLNATTNIATPAAINAVAAIADLNTASTHVRNSWGKERSNYRSYVITKTYPCVSVVNTSGARGHGDAATDEQTLVA